MRDLDLPLLEPKTNPIAEHIKASVELVARASSGANVMRRFYSLSTRAKRSIWHDLSLESPPNHDPGKTKDLEERVGFVGQV